MKYNLLEILNTIILLNYFVSQTLKDRLDLDLPFESEPISDKEKISDKKILYKCLKAFILGLCHPLLAACEMNKEWRGG